MKRYRQSRSRARKSFKRTANRTHKKNMRKRPLMRGGIRL